MQSVALHAYKEIPCKRYLPFHRMWQLVQENDFQGIFFNFFIALFATKKSFFSKTFLKM
jgi:hypothetical protein